MSDLNDTPYVRFGLRPDMLEEEPNGIVVTSIVITGSRLPPVTIEPSLPVRSEIR